MTLGGRLDNAIHDAFNASTQELRDNAFEACMGLVISGASPDYRLREAALVTSDALNLNGYTIWEAAVYQSHLETMGFLRRRHVPFPDNIDKFCQNDMIRDMINVWKKDDELNSWNMYDVSSVDI